MQTSVYTTGEVAQLCNAATRTVGKWIDTGLLVGYRIPGSKDRRVPRENLIAFMRQHGMPLGELAGPSIRVLVVSQDALLVDGLTRELPAEQAFDVRGVADAFDAGVTAAEFQPIVVVVDFAIGTVEALQICRRLRQTAALLEAVLIGVLPEGGANGFDRSTLNETFKRPFDPALLAVRLRRMLATQAALA
jgi:excisionase family DNA binding protein